MNGRVPRSPAEELALAVVALRRGEVVAYPTETFYGLAVDPFDELALARLRELKGRGDKGISLLVVGVGVLERVCAPPSAKARALMERYWPGALTLALPARPDVPEALVIEGCVAVRESSHPLARALVRAFGGPLTTTSANLAGQRPATTPAEVEAALGGRCAVLPGGATPGGAPSTLARVRGTRIEVLRAGAVTIAPEFLADE
ncbi:MAG TPA: L-threonylcarbamoyladenylate synthase [Polyangia bacterium]|nr:L-threonylcarbamoyladenylate synthase [Polyangia bacterium]